MRISSPSHALLAEWTKSVLSIRFLQIPLLLKEWKSDRMASPRQTEPIFKSQLPKMKVFQLTLDNFALAGIVPSLAIQSCPLNGKILLIFSIIGLSMFCNFKFTFYGAKTFVEYTQSIYMGSMATIVFFVQLILILKLKNLFKLTNDCESIANTS